MNREHQQLMVHQICKCPKACGTALLDNRYSLLSVHHVRTSRDELRHDSPDQAAASPHLFYGGLPGCECRGGDGRELLEGQREGHRLQRAQVVHHELAAFAQHNEPCHLPSRARPQAPLRRHQRKALHRAKPWQRVCTLRLRTPSPPKPLVHIPRGKTSEQSMSPLVHRCEHSATMQDRPFKCQCRAHHTLQGHKGGGGGRTSSVGPWRGSMLSTSGCSASWPPRTRRLLWPPGLAPDTWRRARTAAAGSSAGANRSSVCRCAGSGISGGTSPAR